MEGLSFLVNELVGGVASLFLGVTCNAKDATIISSSSILIGMVASMGEVLAPLHIVEFPKTQPLPSPILQPLLDHIK